MILWILFLFLIEYNWSELFLLNLYLVLVLPFKIITWRWPTWSETCATIRRWETPSSTSRRPSGRRRSCDRRAPTRCDTGPRTPAGWWTRYTGEEWNPKNIKHKIKMTLHGNLRSWNSLWDTSINHTVCFWERMCTYWITLIISTHIPILKYIKQHK